MQHYTGKHGMIIAPSWEEKKKKQEARKRRVVKFSATQNKAYVPPYGKQEILDRLSGKN